MDNAGVAQYYGEGYPDRVGTRSPGPGIGFRRPEVSLRQGLLLGWWWRCEHQWSRPDNHACWEWPRPGTGRQRVPGNEQRRNSDRIRVVEQYRPRVGPVAANGGCKLTLRRSRVGCREAAGSSPARKQSLE